jgi:hypothetical protein
MTKKEIKNRLAEINTRLWSLIRKLTLTCTPYDMDDEYKQLIAEEAELKGQLAEVRRVNAVRLAGIHEAMDAN